MNSQQKFYAKTFRSHIPSYEEQVLSSISDFNALLSLDDPPIVHSIDISPLKISPNLNNNPLFQSFLGYLINWNEKVNTYKEKAPNSLQKSDYKLLVENNIYTQLKELLREVIITEDKNLQSNLLNNINVWYCSTVGRPLIEPKQISITRPGTSKETIISDEKTNETRLRLKDFSRRLPNSNNISMNSTTLGFSINPNFLSRPQTSSNGIMGQLNENLEGNRPKTTMEKKRGDTIKIGDLMGRTINNVEEQNMIIRQEIRSKFGSSQQRPLTVKSNFINYWQEGEQEKNIENIWINRRNKELREKREDEEFVLFMKEWGKNKGRLETEINRKSEGNQFGSNFNVLKIEKQKEIIMKNEDEDLLLQEYPSPDNPINEFMRLEQGNDINNVRVFDEPIEIKGGTEIYNDSRKEDYVADFLNDLQTKKNEEKAQIKENRFVTPNKQINKKEHIINENNGTINAKSQNSQSNMQTASTKLISTDKVKDYNSIFNTNKKELIISTIKKTASDSKFQFSYRKTANGKLIGNIANSPVISFENQHDKKPSKSINLSSEKTLKPKRSSLEDIENIISKMKIDKIRKYGNCNLNYSNTKSENSMPSLSVYTRPFTALINYRKFSNVLKNELISEQKRQEEIKEITSIKKKMAKWKISCSTKKLQTALMTPIFDIDEKCKIYEPGGFLIENPFNKVEKKKIKKKEKS